jgi:hypothetical protein
MTAPNDSFQRTVLATAVERRQVSSVVREQLSKQEGGTHVFR